MFTMIEMEEHVRIPPSELGVPPVLAIRRQLGKQVLDKIMPHEGLAVHIAAVLQVEGGALHPGESSPDLLVRFSLVLFRPFLGEVIVGRLARCDKTGIFVSLGFFEDIFIPAASLQKPSEFDTEEELWVWKYDGNDMHMDIDMDIRFRVQKVVFQEQGVRKGEVASAHFVGTAGCFAPMVVVGVINEDGLGLVSWWSAPDDGEQ